MRMLAAVSIAACVSLLAACSSTPTQYLTLVPPAARSAPDSANALGPALLSVTIPSQVDQPQLAIRRADGSMTLLETERWIAPLSDEIIPLSHPACRHAARTISSPMRIGVWRVVSGDSGLHQSFLLIDCTVRFSLPLRRAMSTNRYSVIPAYGQILLRQLLFTLGILLA